ncbi:MAG: hypothetical protein IE909_07415 [Campylobacterales bacterium]|nr:hypothetical protein [Campylobacterales bacterium]
MFKDSKKQFINILTQDKQIKIDLKIFEKNTLQKSENATFLKADGEFSKDLLQKLQILEHNINQTYTTTLLHTNDQFVVSKDSLENESQSSMIDLGSSHCVVVSKNTIDRSKEYYKNSIDYFISPFTILYETIKASNKTNSLNGFIFDNKIYLLLLDDQLKISYSALYNLTSFDKVQESNFYTDEIIGQKLYDEVYFLEIQQILNEVIENYYASKDGADFIESIHLYYSIKQLSDDQLDALEESLVSKVNYYGLAVNEILFEFVKANKIESFSLTSAREKKQDKKIYLWLGLVLVSCFAAFGLIYNAYEQNNDSLLNQSKANLQSKQQIKQPQSVVQKINVPLPDHQSINESLMKEMLVLFDAVPYDGVLKKVQFDQNTTNMVINFIANSSSIQEFEKTLNTQYAPTKMVLKDTQSAISSTIFSSLLNNNTTVVSKEYGNNNKYLTTSETITYLKKIINNDSLVVKFLDKVTKEYVEYSFDMLLSVQSTQDIYNIFNLLNKQSYSITIAKPIVIETLNDNLETKFSIKFSQNKQPIPQK